MKYNIYLLFGVNTNSLRTKDDGAIIFHYQSKGVGSSKFEHKGREKEGERERDKKNKKLSNGNTRKWTN